MTEESKRYKEFVQRLETKYPELFAHPYGGVDTGEGWWPIIELLCYEIDSHTKWRKVSCTVAQIKEKFGTLRFYYDGGDETISGMVTMAEAISSVTCEVCGSPGKLRQGGWLRTLCDEHEVKK